MCVFWCRDLERKFDGITAIDSVSIDIRTSEIVGVIGPNGAGKTTLVNVLTGFLEPDGGCFGVGDRPGESPLTGASPQAIAATGVGRTFQEVRFARELTVLDNVLLAFPAQIGETVTGALFGLRARKQEREFQKRANDLLEFVGLRQQARSKAKHLSFGQRKLLSLAACMATDATFLFLDEPVAGVSPEFRKETALLLRDLKPNKGIVIIEHDLQFIREVADRVLLMDGGRILRDGITTDVLEDPVTLEAYIG